MADSQYRDRDKLEIFSVKKFAEPFSQLAQAILGPGDVPPQLKGEVFTVVSLAAGCRHCQAHGAYGLHTRGTPDERIQALWDFERSSHFSEPERSALRFARDAGTVPNGVTARHFEDLRTHYADAQITEMLAVIALSGFLNRYSDTLAVVTDQESVDWAKRFLAPLGWRLGKHAGSSSEQRTAAPALGRPIEALVPKPT